MRNFLQVKAFKISCKHFHNYFKSALTLYNVYVFDTCVNSTVKTIKKSNLFMKFSRSLNLSLQVAKVICRHIFIVILKVQQITSCLSLNQK